VASIALLSADSPPARIHEFYAFAAVIADIAGYFQHPTSKWPESRNRARQSGPGTVGRLCLPRIFMVDSPSPYPGRNP
jgi:hypothetical protein